MSSQNPSVSNTLAPLHHPLEKKEPQLNPLFATSQQKDPGVHDDNPSKKGVFHAGLACV